MDFDIPDFDDLGAIGVILVVVLIALLVLIVAPFLLMLSVLVLEVALLLVLVPIYTIGRALTVGKWPVEVRCAGEVEFVTSVRGWRGSQQAIEDIAARIRTGAQTAR